MLGSGYGDYSRDFLIVFGISGRMGGGLSRAMRSTRMMRIMVGLMGRVAFILIFFSVIFMMDSRTMARFSWFYLGRSDG